MTTHITDAKQAVDYYLQGVPSEAVRLRNLFDTYGDWTGAAEQVKNCLGYPYVFGNARGDEHTATVENIAGELRRRAEEHGVKVVADGLSGEIIPTSEIIEYAGAPADRLAHDNWHVDKEAVREVIKILEADEITNYEYNLFALINDGRGEGPCWFPVYIGGADG